MCQLQCLNNVVAGVLAAVAILTSNESLRKIVAAFGQDRKRQVTVVILQTRLISEFVSQHR
jgi:hypothetical protein